MTRTSSNAIPVLELFPRRRSSGFLTRTDLKTNIRIGDTVQTVCSAARRGEVKYIDPKSCLFWILFEDNAVSQSPMYRDKIRKVDI